MNGGTRTARPGIAMAPSTVKTTMGPVELQRPKLRDTDQRFCSRLFGDGVTRTNALEALVISGWVRGLSDRDIEAALGEVLGGQAALSRSTVSRICSAIKDEFAALARLPNGHHRTIVETVAASTLTSPTDARTAP